MIEPTKLKIEVSPEIGTVSALLIRASPAVLPTGRGTRFWPWVCMWLGRGLSPVVSAEGGSEAIVGEVFLGFAEDAAKG